MDPNTLTVIVTGVFGVITLWINSKVATLKTDNETCVKRAADLEAKLAACETRHNSVELRVDQLERRSPNRQIPAPPAPPPPAGEPTPKTGEQYA